MSPAGLRLVPKERREHGDRRTPTPRLPPLAARGAGGCGRRGAEPGRRSEGCSAKGRLVGANGEEAKLLNFYNWDTYIGADDAGGLPEGDAGWR